MIKRYAYWISTGLLSLLYIGSATFYLSDLDAARQLIVSLGYPAYLITVLITVKILWVATVLSRFNVALSDLAYAGMFFHLLLAFSAHINMAQYGAAIPAIVALLILATSFLTQNAARAKQSPYVNG